MEARNLFKHRHDNLIAYIRTKINYLPIEKIHYLIYFINKLSTHNSGCPIFDVNCYYENGQIKTDYIKNEVVFDNGELSPFEYSIINKVINDYGSMRTNEMELIINYDKLPNGIVGLKQFITHEDSEMLKYRLGMYDLYIEEHINIK